MRASQDIINFIAKEEGFRDTAYQPISGDLWTIGYGFTTIEGSPVHEGDTITQSQASHLLTAKIGNTADQVSAKQIPLSITQNQFDAVVSLVYNIGIGNWLKSDTAKLFYAGVDISNKFPKWDKSGGKVIQGLLNRRLKEQTIYDGGGYV